MRAFKIGNIFGTIIIALYAGKHFLEEYNMSTQEKYVHSLKQIKEAEEKAWAEVQNFKKKVAEDIKSFQIDADKAIEVAKIQGEKLVETSIEQARKKAEIEVKKIIDEAKTKSKTISSQMDEKTIRGILDILLKGVE